MTVILYGVLLAHFYSYKTQYANIGITFVMTVVMKKLIKSVGSTDNADLIGLGGGCLTVGEFAKLLKAMTVSGFSGSTTSKSGLIPDLLESIKGLIIK